VTSSFLLAPVLQQASTIHQNPTFFTALEWKMHEESQKAQKRKKAAENNDREQ